MIALIHFHWRWIPLMPNVDVMAKIENKMTYRDEFTIQIYHAEPFHDWLTRKLLRKIELQQANHAKTGRAATRLSVPTPVTPFPRTAMTTRPTITPPMATATAAKLVPPLQIKATATPATNPDTATATNQTAARNKPKKWVSSKLESLLIAFPLVSNENFKDFWITFQ